MADVQSTTYAQPRADSPSPSVSPTTASSSFETQADRSLSTVSSFASSCTSFSTIDQSTNGDIALKRRGYTRPQATIFADSARNRDSVMSLGTIAHLQHYFARTGLLDGKGGQVAKEVDATGKPLTRPRPYLGDSLRSVSNSYGPDAYSSSQVAPSDVSSPVPGSPALSQTSDASGEPRYFALPPTFSTYKQKKQYIPSPPNPSVLRRELRESLEDAKKVLVEAREESKAQDTESKGDSSPSDSRPTQGWHEVEGLHILDLVTLAIKAAKNYYTSHEQPSRLYSIRSERRIRSDLFAVLEVLKRVASRNFAGGYRQKEIDDILSWISGIEVLIDKDEKAAKKEQAKRESWLWLNGNCNGHEREREWVFLKSFEPSGVFLPVWTEPPSAEDQDTATSFLLAVRDGVALVQLHNELVKNSWQQFGEIKSWHTDTAKPYRSMENLRYWVKAAELRWDVVLEVDVPGVVQGKSAAAWRGFDAAVLKWSKAVREALTLEWKEYREVNKSESRPSTAVQMEAGAATGANDVVSAAVEHIVQSSQPESETMQAQAGENEPQGEDAHKSILDELPAEDPVPRGEEQTEPKSS